MENNQLRQLKQLTASLALILAIWLGGPYLAIGNVKPFTFLSVKLLCTLLVIMPWLVQLIRSIFRNKKSHAEDSQLDETLLLAKNTLKHQFKLAIRSVKKHHRWRRNAKYQCPWVLLLGSKHSGSQSLLKQSGVDIRLLNANETLPSNMQLHWYHNTKAIFIHIPNDIPDSLWQLFLTLAQQHRPKNPISRTAVVLDTECLTNLKQSTNQIQAIASQLHSLKTFDQPIETTLIINKIDLLAGFNAFFAHQTGEEKRQAFGFELNPTQARKKLDDDYSDQFYQWIGLLGRQLLQKIHLERSIIKRGEIKNFPLQLEQLKPNLDQIIAILPCSKLTPITGIFFTSCFQTSSELFVNPDNVFKTNKVISQDEKHAEKIRPHFIEGLLLKLTSVNINELIDQNPKQIWKKLLSYPFIIIFILAAVAYWHYTYNKNIQTINQLKSGLEKLNQDQGYQQFGQLNIIRSVLATLKTDNNSALNWSGLNKANHLEKLADKAYQHLLTKQFSPYIQSVITNSLQQKIHEKSADLYQALQVYLMLSQKNPMQTHTIIRWFRQQWQINSATNSEAKKLTQHLNYALTHHLLDVTPDTDLIEKAREQLIKLPVTQLKLADLQTTHHLASKQLLNSSISGVNLTSIRIPGFYTIENFKKIYHQWIPDSINQPINSDVIGIKKTITTPKEKLISAMQQQYLQDYSEHWFAVLKQIHLSKTNQPTVVDNQTQLLSQAESPLWQIITLVGENVQANPTLYQTQAIFTWQNNKKFADYLSLVNKISQLLEKIQHSPDPDSAAYNNLVMLIHDKNNFIDQLSALNNGLPSPIDQWTHTLVRNTWRTLFAMSGTYLNRLWQNNILPVYQLNIENHFPFAPKGKQSVSLSKFTNYFGPGGTIDTFFNYYLAPFVNHKKLYWTWKQFHQLQLPFSQKTLDSFLRASLIKKMFFEQNQSDPQLQFSLTEDGSSVDVAAFKVAFGNQPFIVNQDATSTEQLFTVLNDNNMDATFGLINNDGENVEHTYHGPWAWLQLFNAATVVPTKDPKVYHVVFKHHRAEISFTLKMKKLINPMIPGILTKYEAPKHL